MVSREHRQVMCYAVEVLITNTPSAPTCSKNDVAKELVEDFLENIQAADNIDVKMVSWFDLNDVHELISTDIELHKAFVLELGKRLKKPLKLARNGLGVRLLISLGCTYSDLISDVLMLRFYKDTGRTTRR